MKIYKSIFLSAETGNKLHNKIDNSICFAIQLPIDTDITTWEEITDEEADKIIKVQEQLLNNKIKNI